MSRRTGSHRIAPLYRAEARAQPGAFYQGDFFGPNHQITPSVAVFCSRFN